MLPQGRARPLTGKGGGSGGGGGSSRARARPFCVGGILVCLFLDMDIPSCEESDNRILLEIVSPVIPGIKFPHVH